MPHRFLPQMYAHDVPEPIELIEMCHKFLMCVFAPGVCVIEDFCLTKIATDRVFGPFLGALKIH